jgi:peptidoglycan-associated lipoprotein
VKSLPIFVVLVVTVPLIMAVGCAKKARPAMPPEEPMVTEPEEPVAQPEPEVPVEVIEPLILDDVNFDYDKYNIRPDARAILLGHGGTLQDNEDVTVLIEGHCDERGTNEYNMALGEQRARSTRDFLMSYGIHVTRLSIISYGEERPLDLGHAEDAWAKNRRAHFVVEGGY